MKYNYQIVIEYLGLGFVGWQFQKNGKSIQAVVEKALSKALNSKLKLSDQGEQFRGKCMGSKCTFIVQNEIKDLFKLLSTLNFFK